MRPKVTMLKMCINCHTCKPMLYEFEKKDENRDDIHQYNYSCYKCLIKLKENVFFIWLMDFLE